MMEELFNKITSNGCREMTEARFNEALKEYKQYILKLVDEMIKRNEDEMDKDKPASILQMARWQEQIDCLTELKQKIEAL